ncbi:MAG: T9SS type A sorting domain-containing protein [Bacteroidota bacterium]|nr:T9SS type A sorting domain-containing protein [Bacteroidota bacterium]
MKFCTFFGLLILTFSGLNAQQLAFPGAEGFGRFTTGGRGGVVYEVTNLNDSGAGSLRAAIQASGARTVVFRVSGNIELQSRITISNGDITIAGQTAPGDGICLKNYELIISADNVIVRYIRVRTGNQVQTGEYDAGWGRDHKNIIIDHCSFSWANDEVASFYDNTNFTMQWCIISESFYHSTHPKGDHGYGGIWGGMGATFHHNLIAHHTSRNPRFCGARYHTSTYTTELVDFRNNVIYNWGSNSAYGGEYGQQNMVNNYFEPGPATKTGKYRYRIVNPSDTKADTLSKWYISGNYVDGNAAVTADNWNGGVQPDLTSIPVTSFKVTSPFNVAPVTTETAQEAFVSVLAKAGSFLPKRDTVDGRIVDETRKGIVNFGGAYGPGKGIIDNVEQVGGYPMLKNVTPLADSDHDGMPDVWETAHGLNPNDPSDRNGDKNADGYTNLEDYLNSINEQSYLTGLKTVQSYDFKINSFPNPFVQSTTVLFEVKEKSKVFVAILNMQGKQLKVLMNNELLAGQYRVEWNGTRTDNKMVSPGIYLCNIQIGNEKVARELLLVKE